VREQSTHLGTILVPSLRGGPHAADRLRKARNAFYGLVPAGMLNPNLSAQDKAFLWRIVVAPTLIFGGSISALSAADVGRLETWQASALKTAVGLPRWAHHTALIEALRVTRVRDRLRVDALKSFCRAFQSQHRLRTLFIKALAILFSNPNAFSGTFIGSVYDLCGRRWEVMFKIACGHIEPALLRPPRPHSGLTDSLRWLLQSTSPEAQLLVRLLCGAILTD